MLMIVIRAQNRSEIGHIQDWFQMSKKIQNFYWSDRTSTGRLSLGRNISLASDYRTTISFEDWYSSRPIFMTSSTSGAISGLKVRLTSKWRPFWKFRNISYRFILTLNMEIPSKINPPKYFWCWWRQSVPSILMFKWNCHIFRDTGRSFWPIITKLCPHM